MKCVPAYEEDRAASFHGDGGGTRFTVEQRHFADELSLGKVGKNLASPFNSGVASKYQDEPIAYIAFTHQYASGVYFNFFSMPSQ
jgi:hypothetical protein